MIIKSLFTNFAIIVAMLFLYTQIINKHPLNRQSPYPEKAVAGILGGLLGIVLMSFSIHVGTAIIDLRHISVILLSYYGGPIPAILATLVIVAGRLFIGFNVSALFGVIFIVLTAFFSIFMIKKSFSKKIKILSIMTFSNIVFTCLLMTLIPAPQNR